MERFSLFFVPVVLLVVQSLGSYGLASNINVDRSSLLALKSSITLDPHNNLRNNWTIENSICSWIGVSCDSDFSRVVALNISNMELLGRIPPEIGNLSFLVSLDMNGNSFHGPIPPSIFNMSSLKVLVLRNNSLKSKLPVDMCKHGLHRLKELDFTSNEYLYGEIPSSLEKCSQLEELSLTNNYFVGNVPKEIGNLTELRILRLGNNFFSGIPEEIGHLHNLQDLSMSFNKLTGHLSLINFNVFNISSLERLDLSGNMIRGSIPPQIGNMTMLSWLYLFNNAFTGNIPRELFTANIRVIALSNNFIESFIPPQIERSINLEYLDLAENHLSGNIPRELFTANMKEIIISNNFIEGSIPPQIERSINLEYLNLAENHLSGELPSTIWNLSGNLNYIILHSNKLTGEIPSSMCNLISLKFLLLSNNSLEGSIPQCLGNFSKSLEVLHLKDNRLYGLIPSTFTQDCALKSLNLNGNQFGGMLPRTLPNCRKLEVLDIGNNDIQDKFPFWMETLQELRVLVLRSNRFYGTLSLPIKANDPFPKLQVFVIGQNEFTGSLPARYLNNFRAMRDVKENEIESNNWFRKYYESMVFVIKGSEQQIERILTTFTTIDMSENNFSGGIPESMGRLNSLRYLNLSHNNLMGHIPSSLGNMSMLESMDLSLNHLDGEIPAQLTSLTFLAKLNLSMNNLSGRIPQSPQFSENDAYIGNQGLCGIPLPKKCEGDDGPPNSPSEFPYDDDDTTFLDVFTWQVVALGYGCGFVVGIGMGYLSIRSGWPKWLMELFFGVESKTKKTKRRNRGNLARGGGLDCA